MHDVESDVAHRVVCLSSHVCDMYRGDAPGEIWYAQLLLLFSLRTRRGHETELAFVRWFEETQRPSHASNLKLRALKWATVSAPRPIRGKVPQTDILQLDAIIGPCFVQQDPINSGLFYFTGLEIQLMKPCSYAAQLDFHQVRA
jgi:hypothetical protein